MADKPLKPIYARAETRELLKKMADQETRSFTDQLTVIVREAAERRGISIESDETLGNKRARSA